MFGYIDVREHSVNSRTVYMEIYGGNKVSYRVTSGQMMRYGSESKTYGVEIEDHNSGRTASIRDFSADIEDAVDFAELLVSEHCVPQQLYAMALKYLYISI